MARIAIRRLATLVPLVWLVVTLTFLVVKLAPGSYADTLDHPRLTPEAREALRASYGLDRPLGEQYLRWLSAAATGDLGGSYLYKEPVSRVIGRALPPTVLLAGTALLLDLVLGLLLAMTAARRPYGWVDRLTGVLGLGIYGMPSFWIAGLLVLVFALGLGWLPVSHMHSVDAGQLSAQGRLLDLLRHLVLPAASLGLVGAAATARLLRSTLLEARASRFVLAARARGLSRSRILWVHSLRPALLPAITALGLSLPMVVSGSVVIESVFSWPGMGMALWRAAEARDVPLVMGLTLVGAAAVIVGNLVADLLYAVADPRAREER
ncbi:MAG TPA: ABC transporter permease [Thermoanaerobaculales bacterium]|nr:ABC transporter permease [Thermoanaerobaculales bacterium]HPA79639.1 ABC transporter permease [Thermoanaerobaculales bacterium]HQL29662.1 ABC transporter permease [Thermoanaerobaculales bacterium]HQN97122.1 ABC transporter permease [Thermoanaerobaculales bacterium]HQP42817.1 ABC transporter permease [Thermoanaerobaculales bacterium]